VSTTAGATASDMTTGTISDAIKRRDSVTITATTLDRANGRTLSAKMATDSTTAMATVSAGATVIVTETAAEAVPDMIAARDATAATLSDAGTAMATVSASRTETAGEREMATARASAMAPETATSICRSSRVMAVGNPLPRGTGFITAVDTADSRYPMCPAR